QEKLIDDQEKASTDQEKVLADQEKLIVDQERQLTRLGSMHESIMQRVVKRAEKAENEVKRLERRDTQDDDEPSDNEEADDIKTGTRGGSKQVPDPDGKCQVVGGDYQVPETYVPIVRADFPGPEWRVFGRGSSRYGVFHNREPRHMFTSLARAQEFKLSLAPKFN
ncbi:hypothetical protein TrRE_jg1280, partial [Triparma retinervis]